MKHALPRAAALAASFVLVAAAAAAQAQPSSDTQQRGSSDLSLNCPPTAAGHPRAKATPLTAKHDPAFRKEMRQCTSEKDRQARAECVRSAWEARAGEATSVASADMANCR